MLNNHVIKYVIVIDYYYCHNQAALRNLTIHFYGFYGYNGNFTGFAKTIKDTVFGHTGGVLSGIL